MPVHGRVGLLAQSLSHPVSPLKGGHLADKVEQARESVDAAPSFPQILVTLTVYL